MEIIIFLIILFYVTSFLYWLIDSTGPKQFGNGVVMGKEFIPGRWKYIPGSTSSNGSSSPGRCIWIPDNYVLRIRVAGAKPGISVPQKVYESFNEEDIIPVKYSEGRLWQHKIYIKRVGHCIAQGVYEPWECPNCKTINHQKSYECEKCRWGA